MRDATGKSNQTKWGLVCDKLSAILANEHLTEDEHDAIAAAVNYLDECDGEHRHAKQSPSTAECTPIPYFTDRVYAAYKGALKAYIEAVPPAERAQRWKQNGHGWVIPDREKAEIRFHAMMIELEKEQGRHVAPSSTAAKELAPLPDCMIGPSEPCEGYQRLQRELNAMRSATKETVNAPCDDKHECCCPDECQEAGECLVAMGVVRRPSSTRVKIK